MLAQTFETKGVQHHGQRDAYSGIYVSQHRNNVSLSLTGDLPKQVKVKKLSKLKTMDTKPGDLMSAVGLVVPVTG